MSELADVFTEDSSEPVTEASESETVENEEGTTPNESVESGEVETKDNEGKPEEPDKPEESEESYSDREKAYLAQAKDERQKRKERDERIQELESKLSALENPNKEVETPDVFEDQEAYTNHLRSEFQMEVSRAKLDLARDMMMSYHDDYVEVEEYVMEQVKSNPFLKDEIQKSSNIPKAVYDLGRQMQNFQQMKQFNADEHEAKLRAKWEAELKEKESRKAQEETQKASDLSPSLANARGSNVADEKEITDISDVF